MHHMHRQALTYSQMLRSSLWSYRTVRSFGEHLSLNINVEVYRLRSTGSVPPRARPQRFKFFGALAEYLVEQCLEDIEGQNSV